jgi:hypothetical protein
MTCVKPLGGSGGVGPFASTAVVFPVFRFGRLSPDRKLGLAPCRGVQRDCPIWSLYGVSRSVSEEH